MPLAFVKPWTSLVSPSEPVSDRVPSLDLLIMAADGRWQLETFLVDAGADISLASRQLCDELGLQWDAGTVINLRGISPKPECVVAARIHDVELIVPDIGMAVSIPICFADGDASQLLGREGFFDCFRVEYDKSQLRTRVELVTDAGA